MHTIYMIIFMLFLFNPKVSSSIIGQNSVYPDTIVVKTSEIKGFGPFERSCFIFLSLNEKHPMHRAKPNITGIPDTLNNLLFNTLEMDNAQHLYQSYHAGKISKEVYLNYVKGWEVDTTRLTKQMVKQSIAVAAGLDHQGRTVVVIDKNNNYDLSDDVPYLLPLYISKEHFWSKPIESLLKEVEFEYFDGEKIVKSKIWLYVDHDPDGNSKSLKDLKSINLGINTAEHRIGTFQLGNKNFSLAIKCAGRNVYRKINSYVMVLDEKGTSLTERAIGQGRVIVIENTPYRFVHTSINGEYVTLVKDIAVVKKGGAAVVLKAPEFSGKTITGKNIDLKNFQGKYVFLDFWTTWCAPCLAEMPKLKTVYDKYQNQNFEVIGITQGEIKEINQFLEKEGITWPQVHQDKNNDKIIKLYNVRAYPTTILIDPQGIIIAINLGAKELDQKLMEVF